MKTKYKFKDFDYTSFNDLNCIRKKEIKVKILGYIRSIEKPQFQPGKREFSYSSKLTLFDNELDEISDVEVEGKKYKLLVERQRTGEAIEAIAGVSKVQVRKGKQQFFLNKVKLLQIRTGEKPLRKLQASNDEIDAVKKFVKELKREPLPWALFDSLKESITEHCHIAGLARNKEYSDAVDAVIAQSLSGGEVGNSSGKIHLAVIGSSASGKGLLFMGASLLNVTTSEAQSGSVSQPGLAGSCVCKDGVWKVTKGKIPLANKGVFGMQDFDKCKDKSGMFEILGPVMEDGKCIISKAGSGCFKAETSIYIDINKASDVFLDGHKRRSIIEDTGLPTYIISRLDFVIDLPKDLERQIKTTAESISDSDDRSRKDRIFKYCEVNQLDYERFHKLLTAYIMETYEEVDVEQVRNLILNKFGELVEANRDKFHLLDDVSMFLMRFKNSIFKFVKALTRVQLLEVSNKEAVDKAFHLLSRKLEFIKKIEPELAVPRYRTTKADKLALILKETYKRKPFTVEVAYDEYKRQGSPQGPVKKRQFRNWVQMIAKKGEHGKWKLKAKHFK